MFAGIELTSERIRGLRGTSELPGRPATLLYGFCHILLYCIVLLFVVPELRTLSFPLVHCTALFVTLVN